MYLFDRGNDGIVNKKATECGMRLREMFCPCMFERFKTS